VTATVSAGLAGTSALTWRGPGETTVIPTAMAQAMVTTNSTTCRVFLFIGCVFLRKMPRLLETATIRQETLRKTYR
jgi:hypothetical protein